MERFEDYADAIVTRNMRVVAIVALVATAAAWPFDWLYHPGSMGSLLVFRITGVAAPIATLIGLRTSISGNARYVFIVGVCVSIATSLGYAIGEAGELNRSWLGLEVLPFMTILLPWRLPQRILATGCISLAFIVASLLRARPELRVPGLEMIPYFIVGTSVSCVFGHAVFRLLSQNWEHRRELAERARQLEESDRKKSEVIAAIVSQRTTELRGLAAHLEATREGERVRVSRAIQDQIAQVLTGVRMEVAVAARQPQLTSDVFERLDAMLAAAITENRDLASDLRPRQLDDLGLYDAVESYVERMRNAVDIALTISPPRLDIEPRVATVVFRILEESVASAVGRGSEGTVKVHLGSESGALVLTVEDDAPNEDSDGYGLLAMRERALASGGVLEIAKRDRGRRARLVVPAHSEGTP